MEVEGATNSIKSKRIGFIGGGNMANAIFKGIIDKCVIEAKQVIVSGPQLAVLDYFAKQGAATTSDNGFLVDSSDIIFICVKPQVLHTAVKQIIDGSKKNWDQKLFVSILAGISIEKIENAFNRSINLVRVMPNTAVAVGEGCCVFACNNKVSAEASKIVKTLLESAGLCLEVPEYQIDAISALSGSGPAFMYLILEALADGGVKMGIPRGHAIKLAAQTMRGAATMVQRSGKHSAVLKDEVCSAGGSTIVGMHALEKGGVRNAMMDAVEAATKRNIEIGETSSSTIKKCNCISKK